MSNKKKKPNHSTIKDHQHRGKTLTPPLATLPSLHATSWLNDRLPEMLWAALIVAHLPRPVMLRTFRKVADYVSQFHEDDPSIHDVTHTGWAKARTDQLDGFLKIVCSTDEHQMALRP